MKGFGKRWTEADLRVAAKEQAQKVAVARVVAGPQRHKMNKTELAFSRLLDLRKHAGEISWYEFEGIKLRLAPNTFLTIDFPVRLADGSIEMFEVKGHMREDAAVKLKVAASQFWFWRFVVVRMSRSGEWQTDCRRGRMETWYKISRYSVDVVAVDVVSSTEKTVTVAGYRGRPNRAAKDSEYGKYFSTWEAAHAYLLNRCESRLRAAESNLTQAQLDRSAVAAMRSPGK